MLIYHLYVQGDEITLSDVSRIFWISWFRDITLELQQLESELESECWCYSETSKMADSCDTSSFITSCNDSYDNCRRIDFTYTEKYSVFFLYYIRRR
jgi:hypothetical protein